jgi:ribose transport system ATP-binding protein
MRGVKKSFGSTVALGGVELAVAPGEVLALVGQNGAGKSTLMSVLSGAVGPDEGSMLLDGEPYAPRSPLDARRAGVAMIYQHLSLAPHLSVRENITLGVEPIRGGLVRHREARRMAGDALRALGHDSIHPDAIVGDLAPAAQQIVEIARALVLECRVLVLDEPTSSLTSSDVQQLFKVIRRLREQGRAIVYISHFLEEVSAISDRFVVLRDGRNAGAGLTSETSPRAVASLMVGRDVETLYPRSSRRIGEPIVDVRNLEPGAATFTLHRGEVFGVAGLVGAGRTELLRAIFGLDDVQSGQIRVGQWSGRAGPSDRWRQGVGFVSEDRGGEGLAADLSVADNLTLSKLDGLGPRGFVRPSKQGAVTRTWIERLRIRAAGPHQAVSDLSGGNQQKVAIARLLYHDVDVLILDEPTRGIDVASKAEIYALIDRAVSDTSERPAKAVLLVSSYLPELLGTCDRIAVMSRGRLGVPRPASAWTEHDLLVAASGALAS